VTLQCPINNTFPNVGTTCGRRERESRREGRREQSLRDHHSFACRGGERHPGLLEGGTLRGASSERGSRSVRQQAAAILRCNAVAPMTADVRRSPRRGTTSACAQSVCAGGRHERSLHVFRGRVLRSVLRHVHVDPHYASREQSPDGGAFELASRLGKPTQVGGTFTGVNTNGRSAARRVSPLPQGSCLAREKKEGGRGLRPLRGSEELGFGCPHVSRSCRSR
jgi:hypothetical protein